MRSAQFFFLFVWNKEHGGDRGAGDGSQVSQSKDTGRKHLTNDTKNNTLFKWPVPDVFQQKGWCARAQKLPLPTVKSERVFTAGAVKEKERSAPRCFLERLLLDVSRKRLPLGHVRLECMLSQNTRL
jgi:hypothetical protein